MAVVRESNPMSKSTQFTTFQTVFSYSFFIFYHILTCLSTVCANLPLAKCRVAHFAVSICSKQSLHVIRFEYLIF